MILLNQAKEKESYIIEKLNVGTSLRNHFKKIGITEGIKILIFKVDENKIQFFVDGKSCTIDKYTSSLIELNQHIKNSKKSLDYNL